MAAAMPPTGLFTPFQTGNLYPSQGQAAQTAQTQEQSDYLDMFNAMNPNLGGGSGVSGGTGKKSTSGASSGFNPTLPQPTLSGGGAGIVSNRVVQDPSGGYDYGKVEGLAQRYAAPGIRQLRNTVQQVQQGYYENPNVKSQTLRDTLAGYGQGLETVMAGAEKSAANVYGQEYGAQVQSALQAADISAKESMQASALASNERLAQYQNEWKAYLMSGQ